MYDNVVCFFFFFSVKEKSFFEWKLGKRNEFFSAVKFSYFSQRILNRWEANEFHTNSIFWRLLEIQKMKIQFWKWISALPTKLDPIQIHHTHSTIKNLFFSSSDLCFFNRLSSVRLILYQQSIIIRKRRNSIVDFELIWKCVFRWRSFSNEEITRRRWKYAWTKRRKNI